ncbi:MAG: glucosidase [Verrucomicrobia bacterium]|nr:MAG: glucosidase [Verrucomicrobiota bacterium]
MTTNPDPGNTTVLRRTAGTSEGCRLAEDAARGANWKRWGPYLADRQWATVREDYSAAGECWDYLPHDHARSRAYRWGEDGLLGFCDRQCRLCVAIALWNGKDPILKERLFGLTNAEGNHGEDAKEEWFHLDSSPTHSFARALYKYPQAAFPYQRLADENRAAGKSRPEFELRDTGIFDDNRYFDVEATYSKQSPDDLLMRVTVSNRGPVDAELHLLPTLWFRNTWSWGCTHEGCSTRPRIRARDANSVETHHEALEPFVWEAAAASDGTVPELLFTENDTNLERLYGVPNESAHVKDAFHRRVVGGESAAVNPKGVGSKVAAWYRLRVPAGSSVTVETRLVAKAEAGMGDRARPGTPGAAGVHGMRARETDEFYDQCLPRGLVGEERRVVRQGYAGLLWSKQFYHYVVDDWLCGDPGQPPPPGARLSGRNTEWRHLYARDVISMPDKWEYPWFAAWDLAFHMVPFARVDGTFAKQQLGLFLREWYMHPNGQLPAYEFALGDVNPPVHAWSAWRVYKLTAERGHRDRDFLESVFQKLLLNFTWWVNRKDAAGKNLFSGGFLGLDNIGVFDRSKPLPGGGTLQQADGTAWMAFYCSTMLAIALELAHDGERLHPAYEDMASKFLEHFVQIAEAMNTVGGTGLWDETDGFFYDQLEMDGRVTPLRTRSLVGLLPLIAVEVLDEAEIARLPGFQRRLKWFVTHKHDLARGIALARSNSRRKLLLAIPTRDRLRRVFRYLFDEAEFLSPFGIRSLSRHHEEHPFSVTIGGETHRVGYLPGESDSFLFGGNSNWRGPVWFPVNYLLIEALERYHHFYGDEFTVEFPTGSGRRLTLRQIALDLERRLASLFLPDAAGRRPCHGDDPRFADDPHWRGLVLFHEYFHAETGRGCGANHQTGWTALVVRHLEDLSRSRVPS